MSLLVLNRKDVKHITIHARVEAGPCMYVRFPVDAHVRPHKLSVLVRFQDITSNQVGLLFEHDFNLSRMCSATLHQSTARPPCAHSCGQSRVREKDRGNRFNIFKETLQCWKALSETHKRLH